MNVQMCYSSVDSIVRELELVFKVDGSDYEEKDVDVILSNVKRRINREYQVDLTDRKIDDATFDLGPSRSAVAIMVDNVAAIYGKLCGLSAMARFLMTTQISLSDINYLGYTEDSLKSVLVALLAKSTMPLANEAILAIKSKLGNVNKSMEKRLFLLVVITHELGFQEVTAALAEYLYLGGLA